MTFLTSKTLRMKPDRSSMAHHCTSRSMYFTNRKLASLQSFAMICTLQPPDCINVESRKMCAMG